jgi:hypothetical protein
MENDPYIWAAKLIVGAFLAGFAADEAIRRIAAAYVSAGAPKDQRREYRINGTFIHLDPKLTLWGTDGNVYLSRSSPGENSKLLSYKWKYIGSEQGVDLGFVVQSSEGVGTEEEYRIPVRERYYSENEVQIEWTPPKKVRVRCGGASEASEEIPAFTKVSQAGTQSVAPRSTRTTAYNGEECSGRKILRTAFDRMSQPRRVFLMSALQPPGPDYGEIAGWLYSDDPIIRRSARERLIAGGRQAVPGIANVLLDRDCPPRALFEAISVLDRMKDPAVVNSFPDSGETVIALVNASDHSEPAIRKMARSVLGHGTDGVKEKLRKVIADKERERHAEPAKRIGLTLFEIDLLGSLGTIATYRALAPRPPDGRDPELAASVAAFSQASRISSEAPFARGRPEAARIHYGWGRALAYQNRPSEAKQQFDEFLQALNDSGYGRDYPYSHQMDSAKDYLRNPDPRKLE